MHETHDENSALKPKATLRARTAPARPLSTVEASSSTPAFIAIEHAVAFAAQLVTLPTQRFDFESAQGKAACRQFLLQVEVLADLFQVACCSRTYRAQFSRAYAVLYCEENRCYLPEILEAAQEQLASLWVNGEAYSIAEAVLQAGAALFAAFAELQQGLHEVWTSWLTAGELLQPAQECICELLARFDRVWVVFEAAYVHELMRIETSARQILLTAIQLDRELFRIEEKAKAKGALLLDHSAYHHFRSQFVQVLSDIHQVTCPEPTLAIQVSVLLAAEALARTSLGLQNHPLAKLASAVRNDFAAFRKLLRWCDQHLDHVDPQLSNNLQLTEALAKLAQSWGKAQTFLTNSAQTTQLAQVCSALEAACATCPAFQNLKDSRDAEFFLLLPQLLVLLSLEGKDAGLCADFCPLLKDEASHCYYVHRKLVRAYRFGKLASSSNYYQLLESAILQNTYDASAFVQTRFDNVERCLHKIRWLAIELQRYSPVVWIRFLDVLLA